MSWFPFSRDGRHTTLVLAFAMAGPALSGIVVWAMWQALARAGLWSTFTQLALIVAAAMLITVIGLSMFVSIRAIKIGRDGIEATGGDGADAIRSGDSVVVEKE